MAKSIALSTYDEFKYSGEYWIGDIPEGWSCVQLRYVTSRFANGTTANQLEHDISDFLVSRIETISSGAIDYSRVGYLKDVRNIQAYQLKKNDFLISHINSYEKIGNSALYDGSRPLWHGMNLIRVSPKYNVDVSFLKHLLKSEVFIGAMKRACKPAINQVSVPTSSIKAIKIPFPDFKTQKLIASFLDKKVALVDDLLAIKQKQIELLKERKQIIIQQAVTQGLHPDVPMKDSGVDWIGEIPEHWIVKRAKYLLDEINERSDTGLEELLSVSHMTGVTPRSEKNVTMFMAEDYTGSKLCHSGDLVINIMWAWMGALGVSDRTGIVSPSYGVFREQREGTFVPKYLEMLLKSTKYVEYYNKVSTGLHSSRLRFYGHMLFDMALGFPSYEEQTQIVEHISRECSKVDEAITVQAEQVSKLKEYKTTLINSAVTGKIKVTELA
ncbi:restriction endonuclease subunit S [Agarivorans sp. QJM3NY_33]|uniref:restriction endonuclease subunit S n=1 Tax=Agarivorans sp. QJM3NY_33 TaxID=3421432 RepID=UPI003D7E8C98